MSDIKALEDRLAAALNRIGQAMRQPAAVAVDTAEVERIAAEAEQRVAAADRRAAEAETRLAEVEAAAGAAGQSAAEVARLSQALADEELVAAQTRARNDALHEKLATVEAEVRRLTADLAARDQLTAQFRRVNAQLRQNNLMLREANARGLPDAHLINKAMLTELELIRASRDADRAEIDAVLAGLKPLIGEGADA